MPGLATPTIICSHHRFSPGGQPPTSPSLTLVVNRTIARDPTRTLTIRNAFASDAGRRFRELRGAIRTAVVEEDVFALRQDAGGFVVGQLQTPGPKAFNFAYSYQKLEAFDIWLGRQIDAGILSMSEFPQLGQGMQQAWTDKYIHASYQQGIQRARTELIGAGFDVPTIAASGGIQVAFNQPFHLDRVGALFTRTFSELKGITAAMDQQISRVLAQAMAEGRGPAHIARLLTRTISGPVGDLSLTDTLGRFIPAERRAKIMARTEVIRAHHVATIQEYKNWGAAGVIVQAEWSTAQDGRVCEQCEQLEGLTFTLDEIQGRIPLHAQCRCMAIPFEVNAPPVIEEPVSESLGGFQMPSSANLLPEMVVKKNKDIGGFFMEPLGPDAESLHVSSRAIGMKKHVESRLEARIAALTGEKAEDYKYFIDQAMPDSSSRYLESAPAQLVSNWASSSMDKHRISILMQEAAKEEFGLKKTTMGHVSSKAKKDLVAWLAERDAERMMNGARTFLREMYNETQAVFAEAGITEVTIFRGAGMTKAVAAKLGLVEDIATVGELSLQPMSSFSSNIKTAIGFSHGKKISTILTTEVPVSRVIATPRSGFGCLNESEFVILGGKERMPIFSSPFVYRGWEEKILKSFSDVIEGAQ